PAGRPPPAGPLVPGPAGRRPGGRPGGGPRAPRRGGPCGDATEIGGRRPPERGKPQVAAKPPEEVGRALAAAANVRSTWEANRTRGSEQPGPPPGRWGPADRQGGGGPGGPKRAATVARI